MISIRDANDRGHANHGWLDTWHSFSFADYYDREHMGISALRVINDDTVTAGAGFGTHGHRDMEIISYIVSGALQHRDSIGNGSIIHAGEVQRMSAGTGVMHSEFNASNSESVNFLQIWIRPNQTGAQPGYEQKQFCRNELNGNLRLIVSPDGQIGSLSINQDAFLYAGLLGQNVTVNYEPRKGRLVYVHLARGTLALNGMKLKHGDGASIENESLLILVGESEAEVLLFDLP